MLSSQWLRTARIFETRYSRKHEDLDFYPLQAKFMMREREKNEGHSHWILKIAMLEKLSCKGESCLATVPELCKKNHKSGCAKLHMKLHMFCYENAHSRKMYDFTLIQDLHLRSSCSAGNGRSSMLGMHSLSRKLIKIFCSGANILTFWSNEDTHRKTSQV